ncbi:hypothetical protein [Candidatus Sororendozoicomonas aggregata]|uniref:hypothetical protein n=1 Tax=Candidatus Sororendozoicomonas aggregata TaxID=3073239 RepID=UPI002ED61F91
MPSTPLQRIEIWNTGRSILQQVRSFFYDGFKTPDKMYGPYPEDSEEWGADNLEHRQQFLIKKEKRNTNAHFASVITTKSVEKFHNHTSFYDLGCQIISKKIAYLREDLGGATATDSRIYSALAVYFSYIHGMRNIFIGIASNKQNPNSSALASAHTFVLLISEVDLDNYREKNILHISGDLRAKGIFDEPIVIDPWFNICAPLALYHFRMIEKSNKWTNKIKEIKREKLDAKSPKDFCEEIALQSKIFFFKQALPDFQDYYKGLEEIDDIDKPFVNEGEDDFL